MRALVTDEPISAGRHAQVFAEGSYGTDLELLHLLKDTAEYTKEQLVDPLFESRDEENK